MEMATHYRHGEVDVLQPEGRLDATTAPGFEAELRERAETGTGGLVIDFAHVDHISSAGLRALMVGLMTFARQKRKFVVAGPSADVMEVITLTGFDKVLTLTPDVEIGIAEAGL